MEYLFTKTPLKFFVQSFWRDEAFSYLLSKQNVTELLVLTAKDFNPPLYYLLLHFWMQIFGSSELSLRSLSLFFFAGTVYISFDILTEICKIPWKRALLYLAFIFLNPVLNYYAFEARMYSMITFFATLSFYAFYQKKYKLYLIASTLGMFTHYFMILVLFTQGIYILLSHRKIKDIIQQIKYIATPILLWLPWLGFMLYQKRTLQEGFWIAKTTWKELLYIPALLYTGYEKDFGVYNHNIKGYTPLVEQFSWLLFVFIFLGLFIIYKKRDEIRSVTLYLMLWALLGPTAIFIMSIYFQPYFLPRYLLYATVGLVIFAIYIMEKSPLVLKGILIISALFLTFQYQKLNLKYREKKTVSKTFQEIGALAKPNDLIYAGDFDFFVAKYYLPENKVYLYGKPYEHIPSYVGKVLMKESDVATSIPIYPQRAFVVIHNSGYEIKTR